MNSMDKKGFNSQDICRIINKAGQMGVSKLTLGDLILEFDTQSPAWDPPISRKEMEPELKPAAPSGPMELVDKDVLRSFDEDIRDSAEYAQLMIDDPVAFERLQMLEELEEDRVANEEV